MSRFVRALALFVASAPLLSGKAKGVEGPGPSATPGPTPEPVSLRPLNFERDNLFAGHRSHSSHRSHASHSSHYSGSSGGSYVSPAPPPPPAYVPTPVAPPSPAAPPVGNSFAPSTAPQAPRPVPQRPGASAPHGAASIPSALADDPAPQLTRSEKLRLQVLRVQLALKRHGLYDGPLDGVFNQDTRLGLAHFQTVKNIPATGVMTTPTLNALGVPAVN